MRRLSRSEALSGSNPLIGRVCEASVLVTAAKTLTYAEKFFGLLTIDVMTRSKSILPDETDRTARSFFRKAVARYDMCVSLARTFHMSVPPQSSPMF